MKRIFAVKESTVMLVALALLVLAAGPLMFPPQIRAQEKAASALDKDGWLAVAPGRVEPWSGEIRLAAALPARIAAVLVKANDKVFPGEPLVRLEDEEARTRLATAEAQVAIRKRARGDQGGGAKGERRRAEDGVAEAQNAVLDARAALDNAAIERRAKGGPDADLDKLRGELNRAHESLREQQAELARLDADNNGPAPTQTEIQLRIARLELATAQAAVDKLIVRAPIAGTILQVSGREGELTATVNGPLIVMGDVSALRVRAEVEERDLGSVKIGGNVVVRAPAFRGRDVTGTVSFVAPIVEPGKISTRGQGGRTDVNAAEVVVDLSEAGPLLVGMRVDVYFR